MTSKMKEIAQAMTSRKGWVFAAEIARDLETTCTSVGSTMQVMSKQGLLDARWVDVGLRYRQRKLQRQYKLNSKGRSQLRASIE